MYYILIHGGFGVPVSVYSGQSAQDVGNIAWMYNPNSNQYDRAGHYVEVWTFRINLTSRYVKFKNSME